MIYLPLESIVWEHPNSARYYYEQNGELFSGKATKDYKHRQLIIDKPKKIEYILTIDNKERRALAKKFNLPLLHPRKIYGDYETREQKRARFKKYYLGRKK